GGKDEKPRPPEKLTGLRQTIKIDASVCQAAGLTYFVWKVNRSGSQADKKEVVEAGSTVETPPCWLQACGLCSTHHPENFQVIFARHVSSECKGHFYIARNGVKKQCEKDFTAQSAPMSPTLSPTLTYACFLSTGRRPAWRGPELSKAYDRLDGKLIKNNAPTNTGLTDKSINPPESFDSDRCLYYAENCVMGTNHGLNGDGVAIAFLASGLHLIFESPGQNHF
ncbi:hypothetical protein A6R68_23154, partial [Neotoma lepida]